MGKFRDGLPVTAEAVTLILTTIDRIKDILTRLETTQAEPQGTDHDLIEALRLMVKGGVDDAAMPPAVAQVMPVLQTGAPQQDVSKRSLGTPEGDHAAISATFSQPTAAMREASPTPLGSPVSRSGSMSIRSNT